MFQVRKKTLNPAGLSKTKLNNIGCLKPFTKEPSITSHFKQISSIVLKFKVLSLVYTPAESAWIAFVGLQSQYGAKPNKVLKKDFSSNLNVPNVDLKRVKISLVFLFE